MNYKLNEVTDAEIIEDGLHEEGHESEPTDAEKGQRLVNTQDSGDEDEYDTSPEEAEEQIEEEEKRHEIQE